MTAREIKDKLKSVNKEISKVEAASRRANERFLSQLNETQKNLDDLLAGFRALNNFRDKLDDMG